jgi:hypothetical protein
LFQKRSTLTPWKKFLKFTGEIRFDNSVLTSEGGEGVNFQFPLWGRLDVFWDDPFQLPFILSFHEAAWNFQVIFILEIYFLGFPK